jgi:hypothetical protein
MEIENLVNLFIKEPNSLYNNLFKFNVIILFIIIVLIFVKQENNVTAILSILAISFGLFISNTYVKNIDTEVNDTNKITLYKLDTLQGIVNEYLKKEISLKNTNGGNLSKKDKELIFNKNKLDNLYIDANLIHFLFSIKVLYEYNPNEFYLLLKGTNNILKIRNDIEIFYESEGVYTENIHEMFEMAIQLKTNCINNLQNMIYSVPKMSKMYKYVEDCIDRYYNLIQKSLLKLNEYHLDDIKNHGVNNRTRFIYINQTKGIDLADNFSPMPTKNSSSKLIDLYV